MLLAPCLSWGMVLWDRDQETESYLSPPKWHQKEIKPHRMNLFSLRKCFTVGHVTQTTERKWCHPSDKYQTCIQTRKYQWVDITTNSRRTSFADSLTRQTSSTSLSLYCQGMRGLYKVTLTKCLGVSWENAIDITLISCLFFNWLSATEPLHSRRKKKKKLKETFYFGFKANAAGIWRPGRQYWQIGDTMFHELFPDCKTHSMEARDNAVTEEER